MINLIDYRETYFLEYQLKFHGTFLEYWNYSKNWDFGEKMPENKQIIRSPEVNTEVENIILRGVTIGMIKKAISFSNTFLGKFIGITQILFELKEKQYNFRWIRRAIMSIEDTNMYKLVQLANTFGYIQNHLGA